MTKTLDLNTAIDLLKSGGNLEQVIISDLETSKVGVLDALLLAENGCVVPVGNIVYDDEKIQYDPDFDDVTWGQPVPFRKLKQVLETDKPAAEYVIKLQIKNADMKQWLANHGEQINLVVSGLLESMYEADRLPKP
ncbi:MAG: hypothetical protein LCH81_14285 [Bacteroidetes bacterium]|nr:hypothetical protein [Bacteroidota bacterium]